jgi:hypothetical protein
VTREDQDKINRFSSLHNRIRNLDEQLAVKKVCHLPIASVRNTSQALQVENSMTNPCKVCKLTWSMQKDKEDLEEVTQELELVLDEEEPVRCADRPNVKRAAI